MGKFNMENPVRTTTLYVVKNAESVKINKEKIKELANKITLDDFKMAEWPFEFHFFDKKDEKKSLTYLILLDSLNFCFWPARNASRSDAGGPAQNSSKFRNSKAGKSIKWNLDYNGRNYSGYFGFSLALKKFFENNPDKSNFEYFSKIAKKEFFAIFEGKGELQLLSKRLEITKSVSSYFVKKYSGNPIKFIKLAKGKCSVLVPKIYKELPFFSDTAMYNGKRIFLFKRAQILVSEIYGAFSGKGLGRFEDLKYLTCFPDYKIPQILNSFGILEYSKILQNKINQHKLIRKFSKEEVEIRSATVWAVEYLKEELEKKGQEISSFQVDWILWNMAKRSDLKIPHHLTLTFFY